MTASLLPNGKQTFFDINGNPLVNGSVAFYIPGTSTPKTTWQDAGQTIQNQNPVTLDSLGSAIIYGSGQYRQIVKDALGNLIWDQLTQDFQSIVATQFATLAGSTGSSEIGYLAPVIGASARTVQSKLQEWITPLDYSITAGTGLDDTAAITALINYSAVTGAGINGLGGTYIVQAGALPTTPAKFRMQDITLLTKAGSGSVLASNTLLIGGAGSVLTNVVVDGNMANMTSSTQGGTAIGVLPTANNCCWTNVVAQNATLKGIAFGINNSTGIGSSGHRMVNVSSRGCANLGVECNGTFQSLWLGGDDTANGYGYQVSAPFPANRNAAAGTTVAGGMWFRFNANNNRMIGRKHNDNGRDGCCFDQGSYSNWCIGGEAKRNGDGGYTGAADSTSPGFIGDGQSPADIHIIDCETDDNYGSGCAFYSSIVGLEIRGGRHRNNHRNAGDLASASSYWNGIYVAGNSSGVIIDTMCDDDRQYQGISGPASGSVVPVAQWFTGTILTYPKVAFYNGQNSFLGYGIVTAETTNSITVTPTAVNGINLAAVASGGRVTQRVQHNGAFVDNGGQATIQVTGYGHLQADVPAIQGLDLIGGPFGTNANFSLTGAARDGIELLTNGTFDSDITTGWTYAGSSQSQGTGSSANSPGSLVLSGAAGCQAQSLLTSTALTYLQKPCWIELKFEIFGNIPGQTQVAFQYTVGGTNFTSTYSDNVFGWESQMIGLWLPGAVTNAAVYCTLATTGTSGAQAIFDSLSLQRLIPRGGHYGNSLPTGTLPN